MEHSIFNHSFHHGRFAKRASPSGVVVVRCLAGPVDDRESVGLAVHARCCANWSFVKVDGPMKAGACVARGAPFRFELLKQSQRSGARAGILHTPHGTIETPAYVPVGTNGALKFVDHGQSFDAGTRLMFSNTYHLLVHPGADVIERCGGIHAWSGRNAPFITDSGGFQVFSLAPGAVRGELKSRNTKREGSIIQSTEEGVVFSSYRDGTRIELTPESTIVAQKAIGADIIIPLDELPPQGAGMDQNALRRSVEKSMRWEERSLVEHLKNTNSQAMFAVVHGGLDQRLREYSADYLARLPFDGFAIGGSLGRSVEDASQVLQYVMPKLPPAKPVHLLGLADHGMLLMGIQKGVDTFDSCFPTKAARHGTAFLASHGHNGTTYSRLYLRSGKHKDDMRPIDEACTCLCCRNYSRAFVHHLLKQNEAVGLTLVSVHNIHHTHDIVKQMRQGILDGRV